MRGGVVPAGGSISDYARDVLPEAPQERRAAGALGANLMRFVPPTGETAVAPVGDHVLQFTRSTGGRGAYRLGERWVDTLGAGSAMLAPPDAAIDYRVDADVDLLIVGLPAAALDGAMADAVPDPTGALRPLNGRPFVDADMFGLAHRLWDAVGREGAAAGLLVDEGVAAMGAMLLARAAERHRGRYRGRYGGTGAKAKRMRALGGPVMLHPTDPSEVPRWMLAGQSHDPLAEMVLLAADTYEFVRSVEATVEVAREIPDRDCIRSMQRLRRREEAAIIRLRDLARATAEVALGAGDTTRH